MHIPMKSSKGASVISLGKSTRGGSIILLKNIKMKPLVEEMNG